MKPEALATWEKQRARGKRRFVLITGLLSFGLPFFILVTFFQQRNFNPVFIVLSAVIWAIGGTLFGIIIWHLNERKYLKAIQGNAA